MLQGKCLLVVYCVSHHRCLWGSPHPHVSPLLVFGPARPPWTGKGAVLLVGAVEGSGVGVWWWGDYCYLICRSGVESQGWVAVLNHRRQAKGALSFSVITGLSVKASTLGFFVRLIEALISFFWIAFCLISAYTNFPLRRKAILVFIRLKFNGFFLRWCRESSSQSVLRQDVTWVSGCIRPAHMRAVC